MAQDRRCSLTVTVHKAVNLSLDAVDSKVGGGVFTAGLTVGFQFDPVWRLVWLLFQRRRGRQRR